MPYILHLRAHTGLFMTALVSVLLTGVSAQSASNDVSVGGITRAGTPHDIALTAARTSPLTLVYKRPQTAAPSGSTYRATVVLRAKKRPVSVGVRVSGQAGSQRAVRSKAVRVTRRAWRTVSVSVPASVKASTVLVAVTHRRRVKIKQVRVVRVARSAAVSVAKPAARPTPKPTPTPTPQPTSAWGLLYQTSFSDVTGWTVYNNQTQNNDNSINLSNNVTTSSAGLNIAAIKQSGYSAPYTSGEIVGKGAQVVPNHFRAEVVGTFDDMTGIWPCLLWFRPNNASDGEIDLMEWMGGLWSGDQKRVAITMHNEYGATQDSAKKPLLVKSNTWYDPNVEHTYTMEKVPGKITVWVDGHLISTFAAADKAWWNRIMEVSDRTWYPRITMQVGSGASTKVVPNPDSTFTRSDMQVRSLKLWKLN